MELSSEAFDYGERIPDEYTCSGKDVSPPLSAKEVGPAAASLALIVDDPDAPGQVFDHWLIWNLPPQAGKIPEGIDQKGNPESPKGAVQGENDFGELGYRGPCPPSGPAHQYRLRLYALDTKLDLPPGASKEELLEAMEGHILQEADLAGTYSM